MILNIPVTQRILKNSFIIFFLIIAFLTPYYHNHIHTSLSHLNESDHHLVDNSHEEDASLDTHQHIGFHFHLKKDYYRLNILTKLQPNIKRISIIDPQIFIFNYKDTLSYFVKCPRIFKLKDNFIYHPSGLSPPIF